MLYSVCVIKGFPRPLLAHFDGVTVDWEIAIGIGEFCAGTFSIEHSFLSDFMKVGLASRFLL